MLQRLQKPAFFFHSSLLILQPRLSLWWRLLCYCGVRFVADFPACEGGYLRPIHGLPDVNFTLPGDFNIGVVMSLHRYDPDTLCGNKIRELGALQRLEAMVFAVEEIYNRTDLLPNVTLGLTVLDDCFNKLTALGRALQFIQQDDTAANASGKPSVSAVQAVAVIGAEGSPRTLAMADVLSLFQVPQLSYASSSALLDDDQFSYFSRIVPSDNMQAKAMANVLLAFGWTYVSILYAEGSYGTGGFQAVERNLEELGYCLAVTRMLRLTFTEEDYKETIHKLQAIPQARVVILFISQHQALRLFEAVKMMGLESSFTWVGGDSIGMNPHIFSDRGLSRVVNGVISVNFVSAPVDRFERTFRHMTYKTGSRNPWFGEFISSAFNCSMGSASGPQEQCDEDREIMTSEYYKPESTASLSMNAVYALAHALDAVLKNCTLVDVVKCVEPWHLQVALRNVSFQGEGTFISFDQNGNGQSNYEIRNLVHLPNGTLVQKKVGLWDSASMEFSFFNTTSFHWNEEFLAEASRADENGFVYPVSVCSLPCKPAYQAVVTSSPCCFYCEACRNYERTVLNDLKFPKCERCPTDSNFTWPDDETRTECLPLTPEYISLNEPAGYLIFILDVCVFAMTFATIFFYVRNGHTGLIKSSCKHLSMMMLAGHVMTCFVVVVFVVRPSNVSCIIINGGFHLSFTTSYAPLLVKTSRIYRIFRAATKSAKKPAFVSTRFQVCIVVAIIILQIVVTSIALVLDAPEAVTRMHDIHARYVHLECTVPHDAFLVSTCYNILLMTVCAFLAIKTRSLPSNYNEAKFITFSIYTTVLLWLSFLPVYFTARNYIVEAVSLVSALLFHLVSFQVFLFLPKLYALYFVSEGKMNLRDIGRNSSVDPRRKVSSTEHESREPRGNAFTVDSTTHNQ